MTEQKPGKVQSLFESRRFWVAVAASICAFAKQFDLDLDEQTVTHVVLIASSWIVSDSLRKTE